MGFEPKTRGIIMQAESVRATLDRTKTQTRRVIKPQPMMYDFGPGGICAAFVPPQAVNGMNAVGVNAVNTGNTAYVKMPYGCVGDRLYFKEAIDFIDRGTIDGGWEPTIVYLADKSEVPLSQLMRPEDAALIEGSVMRPVRRNAIFMWSWAARVLVEIESVRIERVSDISEADARAEGVADVAAYKALWDRLNAKRGHPWSAGDWVWVITYRLVDTHV